MKVQLSACWVDRMKTKTNVSFSSCALALRSADSVGGIYDFWKVKKKWMVMCKLLLGQKQLHCKHLHSEHANTKLARNLEWCWRWFYAKLSPSVRAWSFTENKRQWWAVRNVALWPPFLTVHVSPIASLSSLFGLMLHFSLCCQLCFTSTLKESFADVLIRIGICIGLWDCSLNVVLLTGSYVRSC